MMDSHLTVSLNDPLRSSDASIDLSSVDAALRPVLDPLRHAVRTARPVLALSLWERLPLVALLPFHTQLRWAGEIDGLPLTTTMSFLPYQRYDRSLVRAPLYVPEEVHNALSLARMCRVGTSLAMRNDFVWQDWEEGWRNHRHEFQSVCLPGCSYLVVGSVQPMGDIRKAPRPHLGRVAVRRAPQPALLTPGRRIAHPRGEAAQVSRLAETDLVFINLQEIRSASARETSSALILRRARRPTLLIASCLADALTVEPDILDQLPIDFLGASSTSIAFNQVGVVATATLVGRDRPQEQARFDYAVTNLRGQNTALEPILDLAEQAWWAARQHLIIDEDTQARTLQRYFIALETLRRRNPFDADLLTAATQLLEQTIADRAMVSERLDAVLRAAESHFSHSSRWHTLVVTSSGAEAAALRSLLAERLAAPWSEIRAAGLDVCSIHGTPGYRCDSLIAAGYLGARTLDAVLFTRPQEIEFVFDPVEARVALAHLARLSALLARASHDTSDGSADAPNALPTNQPARSCDQRETKQALERALERIGDTLSRIAAGPTRATTSIDPHQAALRLLERLTDSSGVDGVSGYDGGYDHGEALADGAGNALEIDLTTDSGSGSRVLITFADGTSILCSSDRRFDALVDTASGIHGVPAQELAAGDEVIILERATRTVLSDQLMQALDEGILREEFERRKLWLLLTTQLRRMHKRSIRSLCDGLRSRGVSATEATVRLWLPDADHLADGLVPMSWRAFKAFAAELQVPLAENDLREYFDAVRRWRILHRVQGRKLVHLMRSAALGRLDAPTLDRIERLWGWKTRDIAESARLYIVEDCLPWEDLP